jgi:hypothetical protein
MSLKANTQKETTDLKKMNKNLMDETRKLAEAMGFIYRAEGYGGPSGDWMTFTYPDTNTHVVMIYVAIDGNITKSLADALVTCGKIQLRQKFLRDFSPFNYGP